MPKRVIQKDIIRQLATGATYKQIMEVLKLSQNSLYLHIRRIRRTGLEPTDVNALRRHILGPNVKPLKPDTAQRVPLSPLQDKILRLIAANYGPDEIKHIVKVGFQTVRNTACEGFKRVGITRINKPKRIWLAQLRGYFQTVGGEKKITMEDPFFN